MLIIVSSQSQYRCCNSIHHNYAIVIDNCVDVTQQWRCCCIISFVYCLSHHAIVETSLNFDENHDVVLQLSQLRSCRWFIGLTFFSHINFTCIACCLSIFMSLKLDYIGARSRYKIIYLIFKSDGVKSRPIVRRSNSFHAWYELNLLQSSAIFPRWQNSTSIIISFSKVRNSALGN